MKGLSIVLAASLACTYAPAQDAPADGTQEAVQYLIDYVAKSDATFIRNGESNTGKAAADHLTDKYKHFKKDIKSPEDFIRLCVLGEWFNPYLTMNYSNEADELRALGKLLEKGYVYRGLKPVNWCFDCQSALAEAEV